MFLLPQPHRAGLVPLAEVPVALAVTVPLAADVAARFNGAFAIAVLMRCIAVFGVVVFALLTVACAVYCYWRRGKRFYTQ